MSLTQLTDKLGSISKLCEGLLTRIEQEGKAQSQNCERRLFRFLSAHSYGATESQPQSPGRESAPRCCIESLLSIV